VSVDYTRGVTGRDPIGKTMTETLIAAHPDWTDGQLAERINREYDTPVIDAQEVAHWRAVTS
jgi:hypothetical protein